MKDIADDDHRSVAAPVIGIGASAQCDGQVLVTEDMLGMFERTPRFVKRYDDLAARIGEAAAAYAAEVRARSFPTADQTYRPKSLTPLPLRAAAARRCAASFRSSGWGREAPACGSPTERIEAVLAQPPDISETFLREVDENLRRDQLRDFVKTYGSWLIAARDPVPRRERRLHLVAAAQVQRSESRSSSWRRSTRTSAPARPPRPRSSSTSCRRAAARRSAPRRCSPARRSRFSRTTRKLRDRESTSEIAADDGLPQPYRDAASIRQTALEFDSSSRKR